MSIATDSTTVDAKDTAQVSEADEARIWLPVERAVLHLKALGLPHSRATIYRNYDRDELDGITHFGMPIVGEEPSPEERDVVDSEVVDDRESHVMMVEQPSLVAHDLATGLAQDQSRLLRMLESQERVIESQSRTIEAQQERLSLTDGERNALSDQVLALQAAVADPSPVEIRGASKRWYEFWR